MQRIAVSASDKSLDAKVDPRFGRAPYFLIIEPDTIKWKAIDNNVNLGAVQGAGIQTAQLIAQQGVNTVITGNCGPKAFQVLQTAGINVAVNATGTVREAVEQFKKGQVQYATGPNVSSHW